MNQPGLRETTVDAFAVHACRVDKTFGAQDSAVHALNGVDVSFEARAFTAIMGPSGSGKSTLLACLAGLDTVTSGTVWLGQTETSRLGDSELTTLRRDKLGFIFQSFNLMPALTAQQNILLPLEIAGRRVNQQLFDDIVQRLGLGGRLDHRPAELSGGQQQRVAAARALVSSPEVIFADEPTGNLDSHSGAELLRFLRDSVDELGRTLIMVTHDAHAAAYADRVVFMRDGRFVHELSSPTAEKVLDMLKKLEG